jgi:hypothetical protein
MIGEWTVPLWIYAAAGIAILWAKMKKQQRNIYCLTELVQAFVSYEKARAPIEIAIFLLLGSLVAMGVADPSTRAQAFFAGLGWTALASK